jgi:8-oxo-dGTP pyrophosphatase MutT (NUDIX family)
MYPVRNSVKAIIVREGRLLCIRKRDGEGPYYLLPGGGQEKGETFPETARRECLEELGAEVEVGGLRFIREYIGRNHEFAATDDAHQVEFMFECRLLTEPDPARASQPDSDQEGLEWVELAAGPKARVYPRVLLERLLGRHGELYWGDVN